jgi:hypothetical protein
MGPSVKCSVTINASPETIWPHLVEDDGTAGRKKWDWCFAFSPTGQLTENGGKVAVTAHPEGKDLFTLGGVIDKDNVVNEILG